MNSNLSGDKLRSPHVSWVFAQLVTFPISGRGATWVDPLSHGYAVPASRLPPRVLSASGRRPAPTDAAAETGRWATSHRDVAAPRGEPSRQLTRGLQKAKSRLPLWGALVPSGHRSALDRAGRRECPPREGGEGSVRPPSWCPTGREKRFAVSLAFFRLTPIRSRARSKLF